MSTSNEYKVAIIGPQDMVSGFAALGVEPFDAKTSAEVLAQLRGLTKDVEEAGSGPRYAVVAIIEELMAEVDEVEFSKLTRGPLPAVILLPGPAGSQGAATARLRRLAEQAVGAAII